jgi:hypothetical protein
VAECAAGGCMETLIEIKTATKNNLQVMPTPWQPH